jgi:hypothetical protein
MMCIVAAKEATTVPYGNLLEIPNDLLGLGLRLPMLSMSGQNVGKVRLQLGL